MVLPTGCGPSVPSTNKSAVQPLVIRYPIRPPYSNQYWFPIVGTTSPSPVTVATRPEWFANDCTNPPLRLPSMLEPNKWVHCAPPFARLVRSVPGARRAWSEWNAAVGSLYPFTRCHGCQISSEAASSSCGDSLEIQPALPYTP